MPKVTLNKITPFRVCPPEESKAQFLLEINLHYIEAFLMEFGAAIHLYDLCHPQKPNPAIDRKFVNMLRITSGRAGAMAIFNLSKIIEAIRGHLNEVPTLHPFIDTEQLKLAAKLLNARFPFLELVRHAAAHPAELFSSTERVNTNAAIGDFTTPVGQIRSDGGLTINSNFADRTFFTMIEQKIVSYDLTQETLDKLSDVAEQVYSAFVKCSRFSNL